MDPFAFLVAGAAVVVIVLLVFWGERSTWKLFRDPRVRRRRELDWRDRSRWSRLAQSGEQIADPEDERQARSEARLALELAALSERVLRGRWWFWTLLPILAIVTGSIGLILLTVGAVLSVVVLYFYSTRMRTRIQRTAEVNGWDLGPDGGEPIEGDPHG